MANAVTYGFVDLEHLFSQRIAQTGIQVINRAVELTAKEHTRQVNALMGSLVERTTEAQKRFNLPGSGTLQPLDEFGNPLPRHFGEYYTIAFPIQGAGDAWGTNRVSRALMTTAEANSATLDMLRADADWMRRHILAALLDNTSWTYADPEFGDLTVKPLANGDTDQYPMSGGGISTDDHYLAQAAAIADGANPFPTIKDELSEHPDNAGPYVAYTATSLVSSIEGLTVFREPPDAILTADPNSDQLSRVLTDLGPGQELVGYIKGSNIWVVEWKSMPAGYLMVHARGAVEAPLAMREYDAGELQGFFPEFENIDGNRQVSRMLRYAGFGAQNRTSVVVQYIGGAAYVIPTGFATPLSV